MARGRLGPEADANAWQGLQPASIPGVPCAQHREVSLYLLQGGAFPWRCAAEPQSCMRT